MKSTEEVIAQFNEEVNMPVEELEAWLDDPKSAQAGTGVGIESGHKIIEILKKNPTKDPEKYDDEDLEHMRKVVGYTKRHLAQEDHLKETKTPEELENAKSTISLKNWGHDPLKTLDGEQGDGPSSNLVSNGHDIDESQTKDEGEKNPAENGDEVDIGGEEEDEPKDSEGKKRKLDVEGLEPDEEQASAEGKASLSSGDDQEVETGENGGVSEKVEEENGQGEPPRKKVKAKNDDAAQ